MNIKPDSYPNSINLKSNGVTPVAIFGSVTFDVSQIDLTTIKLANAPIKLKGNGKPRTPNEAKLALKELRTLGNRITSEHE